MRRLAILFALCLGGFSSPARADEGARTSVELRVSLPFVRPLGAPSVCPMLAVRVADRWLVGGGYELVQDYDATIRIASDVSGSPVWMSGIRLGGWYRGGAVRDGFSYTLGALVTFSAPSVSVIKVAPKLDNDTYMFDFGLDVSAGHVWQNLRLGAFFLPAWRFGRFSTNEQSQKWNGFTPRFGLSGAWVF
jgi:hypothetical protein